MPSYFRIRPGSCLDTLLIEIAEEDGTAPTRIRSRSAASNEEIDVSIEYFAAVIVAGIAVGVLAHLFARYRGFGLFGDIVVSLIGAFIGAWVFPAFGLSPGGDILTAALTATLGAAGVVVVLRMLKRA